MFGFRNLRARKIFEGAVEKGNFSFSELGAKTLLDGPKI